MVSQFWRLESKVNRLTGLVPSEDWKGASVPGLSPSFCWSRCYRVHVCSARCMPGQLTEKWEMSCWGKKYDFIQKDRWWIMSQPSYQDLDARFYYRTERERKWGNKVKKTFILQNRRGCVYFFSFLQSFIGELCQIISLWAEHRHLSLIVRKRSRVPQGRLWCKIIITKTTKSKG